jgi:hypothetical protein
VNSAMVTWMQVKGYVNRHNISFKLREIRPLLQTAVANVSAKRWSDCIHHVMTE